MRLPSRALSVVWALLVFLVALGGAFVLFATESPSAGLDAARGAALPVPAAAAVPGAEHTRSFDVTTAVSAQGAARITETIVQDFGIVARHGIERVIPLRDDDGVRAVSDLVVSTSAGTPAAVSVRAVSDRVTIRIGDPDRTIRGVHAYRLEYTLAPATLAAGPQASQLRIDAISAWQQPIDRLTYAVTSPAAPTSARCFEGSFGTRAPCGATMPTATGATFTGAGLGSFDTFTVRLTWPRDAVAVGAPIRALDPWAWAYAAAAAVGVGLVAWAYRRRWVRRFADAQAQLWATFGPDAGGPQVQSYDLTDDPAIEFTPPLGLRPGEMGVLDEVSSTEVLTATVIDLAARGALKVTEADGSWDLERTGSVPLTDDEQRVMTTLFGTGTTTSLAGRRREMGTLSASLAEDLTDDLEDRGLAVRGATAASLSTESRGARSLFLGIGAVAAGCFAHAVALDGAGSVTTARVAQAVTTAVVLGLGALVIVGRVARHVTPLGLAARWRVRGFAKFFDGSEAMHARAAADAGLLRQYMGYAIVFGHVDQWVAAFAGADTSDWFVSSSPLAAGVHGFTAASLWTAPSSSSSGFGSGGSFGGGGVGGGGGGSW
jgi:hypothetical protein